MSLNVDINLITISLQYEGQLLTFQINPESINKDIPSSSVNTDVVGLGEIAIPVTPKLASITISSFFWQQYNSFPVKFYINWIKNWQLSKKPAKLITTILPYTMQVVCESFDYESRAGEESDFYFNLSLKEYRPYGAQMLGIAQAKTLLQKLAGLLDETPPVLINVPLPIRVSNNAPKYTSPYIVMQGDTLSSITKKITGTTEKWKELYNENKTILANNINLEGYNLKLKLPTSWISDNSVKSANEMENR